MTKKQVRFCEEYLIDCNASQAAIRAGYSKKNARRIANQLMQNKEVHDRITETLDKLSEEKLASAKEILEYLTSVLRGQSESEIVVIQSDSEGNKKAVKVMKHPDESERLKAAELLAKRYGLLSEKFSLEGTLPVIITGEDNLE